MRGSCDKCGCARNECECEDDRAAIADWRLAVWFLVVWAAAAAILLTPVGLALAALGLGAMYGGWAWAHPKARMRRADKAAAEGLRLRPQAAAHVRHAWAWLGVELALLGGGAVALSVGLGHLA